MLFLKSKYEEVKNVLRQVIKERGGLKWYLALKVKLSRRRWDGVDTVQLHFRGKCQT